MPRGDVWAQKAQTVTPIAAWAFLFLCNLVFASVI